MSSHVLDGVLFRGALLLALAFSTGPAFWSLAIERGAGHLSRRRALGAALLLAVALVLAIAQATLTFAEELTVDAVADVLRATQYGRALGWLAMAAALHVASCIGSPARPWWILATSAIVIVAASRLGHAALGSSVQLAVHAVHVLAVALWFGGLIYLMQRIAQRSLVFGTLARFSRVALVLVAVIAVTGAIRAGAFLQSGVRFSPWLVTLAFKLVLFGAALLIAHGHRRKRLPAVRADSRTAWQRMDVMLTFELWFVACALLVAGLLSQMDPS